MNRQLQREERKKNVICIIRRNIPLWTSIKNLSNSWHWNLSKYYIFFFFLKPQVQWNSLWRKNEITHLFYNYNRKKESEIFLLKLVLIFVFFFFFFFFFIVELARCISTWTFPWKFPANKDTVKLLKTTMDMYKNLLCALRRSVIHCKTGTMDIIHRFLAKTVLREKNIRYYAMVLCTSIQW